MNGYIRCGGFEKANSVVVREDGTRDVIYWRLGDHNVPAVHGVRATLVRYPVHYYVHAYYGPEVMAARSARIVQLGWSSHSFDLPLPPEIVGHYNLLRQGVSIVRDELRGSPTRVRFLYPATIEITSADEWCDRFTIYMNLMACEFYHMLWVVAGTSGHPPSQLTCDPADVSTCPKLLAWLRRFEASKKKLYRENGFDWDPRRGPIGSAEDPCRSGCATSPREGKSS